MEAWAWLIVYLVGFALLQLVLYRYFRRRGSASEGPTSSPGDRTRASADAGRDTPSDRGGDTRTEHPETRVDPGPDTAPEEGDAGGVHCKHCGAQNEREQHYKYCRRCAQPLR